MDKKQDFLEIGIMLFAFLLLLSARKAVAQTLTKPEVVSAAVYLETGRIVRFHPREEPVESPPPELPEAPTLTLSDTVTVFNDSSLDLPEIEAFLQSPLNWKLRGDKPTVLIFHTHTSESYENGSGSYRSAEPGESVIAVGEALKKVLEGEGIRVIHDTTVYDESYQGAYDASLAGVEKIMESNPQIQLLLDIHRDAAEAEGVQIVTTAEVEGQESAKLLILCGSEGGGYEHPYWEENLSIAAKLQSLLEGFSPELCRPLRLCDSRYNQQYYPGSLLIEVGTAGNTVEQAKIAAEYLGKAIAALAEGYELG